MTNYSPKISFLLAESENHVREAIRLMIEFQEGLEIVGEASSTESLLVQACKQPPDIILLDWNLTATHHQRLVTALRKCCPDAVIIAMSIRTESQKTALEMGVDAFLLKNLPPEEFIEAILIAASKN